MLTTEVKDEGFSRVQWLRILLAAHGTRVPGTKVLRAAAQLRPRAANSR